MSVAGKSQITGKVARSITNFDGADTRQKFDTIDTFLGYRSREDFTLLQPGYMIPGSKNVLIDVSGRLKSRKGYTLDGQTGTSGKSILTAFDWDEHKNGAINFRQTSDGNLQFRYDNGTTIIWTTIKGSLSATQPIRFTNYWRNTEVENVVLFVDGSTNVYEWNGAYTTYASSTSNTITKQGTATWAETQFYTGSNKKIMIGGIEYTYTAGEGTTTLTGVTPDPTGAGITAGDLIYQSVITTANSAITAFVSTFKNDFISYLGGQVYYGSASSNNVYVSKQNDYSTVAFTAPVRVVGEGALITLRSLCRAFAPQEDVMYIAGGDSQWYQTKKTLSSDNSKEVFDIIPLKTAANQGAFSQELVSKDKNNVVFVSNEPVFTNIGRVNGILGTPMAGDYSYPIVNDFNGYNFTGGSIKYYKNFIFIAIPTNGVTVILNQTDSNNIFWEAPQTFPFSCFSVIDGVIYGHGFNIDETYRLFDGYNDNGHPIPSRAVFAFNKYGSKGLSKYFNEFWVDGYISQNTKLSVINNFDIGGFQTTSTKILDGSNSSLIAAAKSDASIGKTPLGKKGLGMDSFAVSAVLPPYFNVIFTQPRKDFYFFQPILESTGIDYHWEILSLGPLVNQTMYGNSSIKL